MEKPFLNYMQSLKKIKKEIASLQEEINKLYAREKNELRILEDSMVEIKNSIETERPLLFPYLTQRFSDFPELSECDFFKKEKSGDWTLKDYLFHILFLSNWGRLSIPFPKTKNKIVMKELQNFFIDLGYKVSFSDTKKFGLTVWTYRFYYGDNNRNYVVFILQ